MVFASTCEHESSAFIFASTSSDPICFASSEHFVNFLGARDLGSLSCIEKKRFALSNLAVTVQQIPCSSLQPIVPCWRWCQVTSGIFEWASVQYTRWTFKRIQSFLNPRMEASSYHTFKLCGMEGFWLYSIVLENAKTTRHLVKTSISSFGFDDW